MPLTKLQFIYNLNIFLFISLKDIISINNLTMILKMIGQCDVNLIKIRFSPLLPFSAISLRWRSVENPLQVTWAWLYELSNKNKDCETMIVLLSYFYMLWAIQLAKNSHSHIDHIIKHSWNEVICLSKLIKFC